MEFVLVCEWAHDEQCRQELNFMNIPISLIRMCQKAHIKQIKIVIYTNIYCFLGVVYGVVPVVAFQISHQVPQWIGYLCINWRWNGLSENRQEKTEVKPRFIHKWITKRLQSDIRKLIWKVIRERLRSNKIFLFIAFVRNLFWYSIVSHNYQRNRFECRIDICDDNRIYICVHVSVSVRCLNISTCL